MSEGVRLLDVRRGYDRNTAPKLVIKAEQEQRREARAQAQPRSERSRSEASDALGELHLAKLRPLVTKDKRGRAER